MCGRFTLTSAPEIVAALLGLETEAVSLAPRFNIAPTQQVPVLVRTGSSEPRELVSMRWGLIPSWSKDPAIGSRLINARSETAAEKPSFRAALRRRRCLIPADGFFEWAAQDDRKRPYLIRMADGSPFVFAGLWEGWRADDDAPIVSCTILTTTANAKLAKLHHRMPVIVPAEAFERWLDPDQQDPAGVRDLMGPYTHSEMSYTAVSTWVNDPRHDDPRCIAPAT
ncbi:MAG: SOS response-associated peptidase [Acidobacteriota bacterium]|nr:MAG: SOS response-associated peptidase [Acidobacteriota bacterium]